MSETAVSSTPPAAETATGEQQITPPAQETQPKPTETVDFWKQKAREQETRAKANAKAAERLAEIEEQNKTELQKAVEAARNEGDAAARAELRRERVLDRVEVLAAKDFADAEDARLRLAARADEFVNADGQIDADAIGAALKQLLEDKPHLAAGEPKRFAGPADQGVRSTATLTDPRARDLAQIEADMRASQARRGR